MIAGPHSVAVAINAGDTAWMIVATALVLLMTPGLALFYAGMVRSKSALNMMMLCLICGGVVTVIWAIYGFSLAFGDDLEGIIGGSEYLWLNGVAEKVLGGPVDGIPLMVFSAFQLAFAIIATALIAGAVADRVRLSAWILFTGAWATLVYFPVAHWIFAPGTKEDRGGWIFTRFDVLDFAGGTVIHLNAAAAGLALVVVVGRRIGWRRDPMRPHSIPMVLLGTALLWFGWFGFNAGSALSAGALASTVLMNTQIAAAAGALSWIAVERIRGGRITAIGFASGAVAGLVAVTPACGFVGTAGAFAAGIVAGAVCAIAVGWKYRAGVDDSLDVFGIHGVGAIIGMIVVGLFASLAVNPAGENGLFAGGGASLLGREMLAAVIVIAYSFGVTWLIAFLIEKTIGLRAPASAELAGMDVAGQHETAYDFTGDSVSGFVGRLRPTQRATADVGGDEESA